MAETLEARVIQKVGTEAEWLANPLPLLDGEAAIVRTGDGTPVNLKFGDGGKTFAELPYFIDYSQAAYIAYTDTPTQPIAYTFVGEGTYGAITVTTGYMAVLGWDGTDWSKNAEIELPTTPTNDQTVTGKNKANPARIVNDRLVSTVANNGVQVGAGWAVWVIPFSENKPFVISGWNSVRSEIGFFKGDLPPLGNAGNNANVITSGSASSQGLSKSGGIMKGTTPLLTTYIVITVENATEEPTVHSTLQVEEGTDATAYAPYGEQEVVKGIDSKDIAPNYITIAGQLIPTTSLMLKDGGSTPTENTFTYDNSLAGVYSSLTFSKDGKTIMQRFETKNPLALGISRSFDWNLMQINGVTKHTMSDENAPFRIDGYTIGGNHGFKRYNITLSSHGKTNADIGSVWTDGTNEWVIVGVPDANTIAVSHRLNNSTNLTSNSLTHVSGATNTSAINSTTKTLTDAFPPYKNYSLKTFVDGNEITTTGSFTGSDKLTFVESYEILLKSSIMDWFVANVGTITVPTQPDGISIAKVTNAYSFDTNMMCFTDQSFEPMYDTELPFQDVMFLMNNKLSVAYNVYVPKTVPFVQSGDNYDFRVPMSYVTPTAYRINFDPSRYEKWGRIPDRVMHIATGENLGFTIGFLPVKDGETEKRKVLASRKALQFQESGKIYLSAIDSAEITTFKKGVIYSIQGYKGYYFKEGNRTANYVVDAPQGKYYYYDWHISGVDSISLPDSFDIIEKTTNVSITSKGKVAVNIDSSMPYGYLIVKG